ncbi:hypothetical protein MXB02_14435 [Pseudomonas mosselii]|uniref:hypothetical protein n=1 Tax=Pseudomonas mosselii TaxID=78327 RepID=UPI001FF8D1F2|nr:hypothetical protein [Pseudomonas mosselii]UPF01796.1 hypothetical protein MXB02_14435 [Pseudomonas mosselii]
MNLLSITECRECGSTSLTWDTHNKNISQAQHGRLTTQDIRCQFVLGCDHCSETLAVVSADQVAAWLTETRETSAEPSAPVELDERAQFETCIRREWPMAPISRKRDLLPKDDPCFGDYCDEPLQRAWVGWQMRAALERKPS